MALRLEYPEVSLLLYEAQGASLSSFSTHRETWYSCITLYLFILSGYLLNCAIAQNKETIVT